MSEGDRMALHVAGVTWDEDGVPWGFQVGKSVALLDWQHKREEKEFQRLVWRLRARKYWAAKSPESKARIRDYRRRWALRHPGLVKGYNAKARKKRTGAYRAKQAERQRAVRAIATAERRAATVYTCCVCGTQWSPVGRLPPREPHVCPNGARCKSRLQWLRGKYGAAWREHRPPPVWPFDGAEAAYRRDKAAGKR